MNTEKTMESRRKTYEDLITKLNTFGICAFLRPTGFGKTWTLAKLIKEENFSRILYLYPAEVIKNTAAEAFATYVETEEEQKELADTIRTLKEIPNCEMMTFAKLARFKEKELKELIGFDLIIIDECHRLGGGKTKINTKALFKYNKSAKIVGATATTNRTDGYDVIHEFFKDITVYPYTLHDAFKDELLLRPYYCYCSYDIETDLKEASFMAGEDINNITVKEVLKSKLFDIASIMNMPKIIKQVCSKYTDDSYMKFMIFVNTFTQLEIKKKEVLKWFHEAYPKYSISELTITSENSELANNVNNLDTLKYKKKHIDLIFSVNMLNMGYHVNDITGIIMYRCTTSDIIYTQQLGRVLSSSSNKRAIVFDVVDNLHRKALTNAQIATRKSPRNVEIEPEEDLENDEIKDDNIVNFITYDEDISNIDIVTDTDNTIEQSDSNIDFSKDISDESINDSTNDGDYTGVEDPWYKHMSDLYPEDLIAVGNEATYRELIAKAVAEPMAQRCREAFECHFRKWCKYNNVPYPITDIELKNIFHLSRKDFVEEFRKIIRKNKIKYPMQDAQKLLDIGNNGDGIPMDIFAKWKNVSVKAILELLEV